MGLLHFYRIVMVVGFQTYITKDSCFYDLLKRDDQVMTDKGFQITEELLLYLCSREVPPGARMKNQMASAEVKKTKGVANLRIYIEPTINYVKSFRIPKILHQFHCCSI